MISFRVDERCFIGMQIDNDLFCRNVSKIECHGILGFKFSELIGQQVEPRFAYLTIKGYQTVRLNDQNRTSCGVVVVKSALTTYKPFTLGKTDANYISQIVHR